MTRRETLVEEMAEADLRQIQRRQVARNQRATEWKVRDEMAAKASARSSAAKKGWTTRRDTRDGTP